MATLNFDAQAALGFVLAQTTHIEREVNRIRYQDIQYPGLVPIDTSAHPFAKSVTFYSADMFGRAEWIAGAGAQDIPVAGTERSKYESYIYTAAIGYSYTWEEINQAQMLGMNLQADDAMAARRAYEEMVEEIVFRGDTKKNLQGLINNSDVTATTASNGSWDAAARTSDEIIEDVNRGLLAVGTDTKFTTMADTILLPYEKLNTLATKRVTDTAMTALQYLITNNTYTAMTGMPLMIRAIQGLTTAGSGSSVRMVAYKRDPMVLKMHIPMPHRFLPAFQKTPLEYVVPGVFRLGGLDIRRPKEVRYIDGI